MNRPPSEWAHTIRTFMPIGIPPQRGSTAEEVLNNRVDQMMRSVNVSHSLSQRILCMLNESINNIAMATEMEAIHGINNLNFPTRSTWLKLLLSA